MMAGDTHDFEYYRDARQRRSRSHHFVNGGGGAYLSIGTALDWPDRAVFSDYAFYPRTDALRAKLDAETPFWKWPAWWWVRRFGAWPFSVEALSAAFDFNRAPYFQSFMEVRVERSRVAGGVRRDRRGWSAALARPADRRCRCRRQARRRTTRSKSRCRMPIRVIEVWHLKHWP